MKSTFKLPKTGKGWFSVFLIVAVIAIGSWPIINIFDKEVIFFGMPLLMFWSVAIIFITTAVMIFIDFIGGAD